MESSPQIGTTADATAAKVVTDAHAHAHVYADADADAICLRCRRRLVVGESGFNFDEPSFAALAQALAITAVVTVPFSVVAALAAERRVQIVTRGRGMGVEEMPMARWYKYLRCGTVPYSAAVRLGAREARQAKQFRFRWVSRGKGWDEG